MEYTREDLFLDMADNIMRDCEQLSDKKSKREHIIDRLRRLCQLVEADEV